MARPLTILALLALCPAISIAEGPERPRVKTTTLEWISLSPDSPALWVEGTAPDGPLSIELRVADDTTVISTRETIATDGHFSSLIRPQRLPHALYWVFVSTSRETVRVSVSHGTEAQRTTYAAPEVMNFGQEYERLVDLTRELHRVREHQGRSPDREVWNLWSKEWERKRAAIQTSLDDFRERRRVLARAAEFYQLVSSLLFAKTLHALYAAELGFAEGEPGGDSAVDWSIALDEQIEGFRERREPPGEKEMLGWLNGLGAEEAKDREDASDALGRCGERARSVLNSGLESSDPEVVARCLALLARLPK